MRPAAGGDRGGADAGDRRRGGSTIRDYVGGSGLRGGFQNEFSVYGRTGEPCPACDAAIECVRLAGRASHYCPVSAISRGRRDQVETRTEDLTIVTMRLR